MRRYHPRRRRAVCFRSSGPKRGMVRIQAARYRASLSTQCRQPPSSGWAGKLANGRQYGTEQNQKQHGMLGKMARYLSAILLMAVSATAQTPSTPPLPPPGRLVDIGGWKLHLNCTGEARPAQATVVLESGAGDCSVEWSLVQPKVAAFARVCSYDRAGDGWSRWPRTAARFGRCWRRSSRLGCGALAEHFAPDRRIMGAEGCTSPLRVIDLPVSSLHPDKGSRKPR